MKFANNTGQTRTYPRIRGSAIEDGEVFEVDDERIAAELLANGLFDVVEDQAPTVSTPEPEPAPADDAAGTTPEES